MLSLILINLSQMSIVCLADDVSVYECKQFIIAYRHDWNASQLNTQLHLLRDSRKHVE